MGQTRIAISFVAMFTFLNGIVACHNNVLNTNVSAETENPSFLQFHLTDAPLDSAQSVNINIQQIDLTVSRHGVGVQTSFAYSGFVDLLKLKNGVLQTLGGLRLPPDVTIHQIRLVLGSGSNVVMNDGSTCALDTPSAQQSGVKLLFAPPFTTTSNYLYDITLDFVVDKSVVVQGNGTCLLKPVIKVAAATQTPVLPGPEPRPTAPQSPWASPSPSPGMSPGASPVASAGPVVTPSPFMMFTVNGSASAIVVGGQSDGSFSATSDPQDPPTIAPSDLWSL
jgi:hypothetical protein